MRNESEATNPDSTFVIDEFMLSAIELWVDIISNIANIKGTTKANVNSVPLPFNNHKIYFNLISFSKKGKLLNLNIYLLDKIL